MLSEDVSQLEQALIRFMDCFEAVFDNDWQMTEGCLSGGGFISQNGTFLRPGVEDESNNWGNRGSLLASYRELLRVMEKYGLKT